MGTTEERLATLEGRMAEQSQMFNDFKDTVRQMEQRLDGRFASLEQSVAGIRKDMATDFRWLVGIMLTTSAATVTALVAALAAR